MPLPLNEGHIGTSHILFSEVIIAMGNDHFGA